MILFIYVVVMSFSFFMAYFVKDISTIVNHKLVLDSMSFPLSRIVHLRSFFIDRPWNLLFGTIYESKKTWKISFNFLWSFQPLCYWIHLLWNWYTLSHQSFNLLNVSTADATHPNQIKNQPGYRLYKDDNKLKALQ